MIEMLVRRAAGVYEKETLPGQGLGGYILKSRSSKTTTPINESGASSINGTWHRQRISIHVTRHQQSDKQKLSYSLLLLLNPRILA